MTNHQLQTASVLGEQFVRLQDVLDLLRGVALDMGVAGFAQVARAFNETADRLEHVAETQESPLLPLAVTRGPSDPRRH